MHLNSSNLPNSEETSSLGYTPYKQPKRTIAELSLAWEAHERSKAEVEVQQSTTLASDKESFKITDLLNSGRAFSPQQLKIRLDERGNSMPYPDQDNTAPIRPIFSPQQSNTFKHINIQAPKLNSMNSIPESITSTTLVSVHTLLHPHPT